MFSVKKGADAAAAGWSRLQTEAAGLGGGGGGAGGLQRGRARVRGQRRVRQQGKQERHRQVAALILV